MTSSAHLTVVSFGYLHGTPPTADLSLDVRLHLRDPAASSWCLPLTGRDDRVRAHVLATPGASELLAGLEGVSRVLLKLGTGPVTVAIGCAGGRHRSVALAEELARRLGGSAEHRHVDRPIVT